MEKQAVILMVNDREACNMECTHCYLPYEGVRTPENVVELVKNLKDRYRVVIAGSETLVDLGYLEAYEKAGQKYILTNGVLLAQKPEIFDELERHGIEEIWLSLHFGIQKDLHSVPEKIINDVVSQAKEKGFKVWITVVISPENYNQVNEMCAKVKKMGADTIGFLKYIKLGCANAEEREVLKGKERQEFFDLVQQARDQYAKDDLNIVLHGNFGPRKGSKGEQLAQQNEFCHAAEKIFAIDPDGNVYGCPFLMNEPIGRLTDDFRLEVSEVLCEGQRQKCLTDM